MSSSPERRIAAPFPRPHGGFGYSNGENVKRVELLSGKQFDLAFFPTSGTELELIEAAYLAALPDPSPEAQAIYFGALCSGARFNSIIPEEALAVLSEPRFRFSGLDFSGIKLRKGPVESVEKWLVARGKSIPARTKWIVADILARGGLALVVADQERDLGVVEVCEQFFGTGRKAKNT